MLPVTKRMDKSKRKGNYILARILVGLILSILTRKKTHQLTATEILIMTSMLTAVHFVTTTHERWAT